MSLTAEAEVAVAASADWVRPLRLGLAIGHTLGSGGVLGAFVRLADGRPAILSAAPVIAPTKAKTGDYIHQPGPTDRLITGETRIACLIAPPVLAPDADGASAIVAAPLLDDVNLIGNLAPEGLAEAGRAILGPIAPSDLDLGEAVAVLGRSAPARFGQIEAVDVTLPVMTPDGPLVFAHCLAIRGDGMAASGPGDAGALVYRRHDLSAVGLVIAAAPPTGDGEDQGLTFVLPLAGALHALQADWLSNP